MQGFRGVRCRLGYTLSHENNDREEGLALLPFWLTYFFFLLLVSVNHGNKRQFWTVEGDRYIQMMLSMITGASCGPCGLRGEGIERSHKQNEKMHVHT